ncbi:hypothetical protein KBZ08_09295 [Cyanobium sp. Candia 9D4]|uniref:hypothetical protein n=1 Tax=unclassified Cyanobium TaxID=2627006 RepID=UPI0020CCD227|nr:MULTISPECIES: hypothetical protein [unclassified Cyanobium]MCP9837377.1 hypothetical protein [Cyanobium sp. N.Huapi 1H5]MCP9934109.1 hypothetical protein [Cyanobium sp. Candia 9D4]
MTPYWSDLPDDLRLQVERQEPERQALWAKLRASADSPAEFVELLRLRLDNDAIAAAVAGTAPLSPQEEAMSEDEFFTAIVKTSQANHAAAKARQAPRASTVGVILGGR